MAQYRLLDKTFINNMLCEKGAIVEYDGSPGTTMQPVETNSKVTIPDNWREENGLKRIALAKSLGAPPLRLSAVQADLWISNELENRELAKTQAKTAPAKSLFSTSDADAEKARVEAAAKAKREADEAAAKKSADDAAAKAKAEADKHPVI